MESVSDSGSLAPASELPRLLPADAMSGLRSLFDDEYEPMYRLAFTMLGSDRDAEEVVQIVRRNYAQRQKRRADGRNGRETP